MMSSEAKNDKSAGQYVARTEVKLWLHPEAVSVEEIVSQQQRLWGLSRENATGAAQAILRGLRHHKTKNSSGAVVASVIAAVNYFHHAKSGGNQWIDVSGAGFAEVIWWQAHDALTTKLSNIPLPQQRDFMPEVALLPEKVNLKSALDDLFRQIAGPSATPDDIKTLSSSKFRAILLYTKIRFYCGTPKYSQVDYAKDCSQLERLLGEHYEVLRKVIWKNKQKR